MMSVSSQSGISRRRLFVCPNMFWTVGSYESTCISAFGQNAFGQNRIWPKNGQSFSWPHLAKPHLARISVSKCWPHFAKPHLARIGVLCVLPCVCVLCVQNFWWVSSRFLVGFTRQPENSKRAHLSVPALQTPPKFHEKTPQREKKEWNFRWEREKRTRNFGPPTPSGPHPSNTPPKKNLAKCGLAKFGQQKLAKFGQIRMAKCGQLTLA